MRHELLAVLHNMHKRLTVLGHSMRALQHLRTEVRAQVRTNQQLIEIFENYHAAVGRKQVEQEKRISRIEQLLQAAGVVDGGR